MRKLGFIILAICSFEVILRLFGFGQLPVYYQSPDFDYALKASQDVHRFGNEFYINKHGMRSAELREDEFRILKFGDSVVNGGIATDQEDLASSRLEGFYSGSLPDVRVLNISAGSWGPDNAFAWMQKFGNFDAKAIILLFSSHDWQDQMEFREVVGHTPFYPDSEPVTALGDAATWLYSRYAGSVEWQSLPRMKNAVARKMDHNPGWDSFVHYCQMNNMPLVVYHHPSRTEAMSQSWSLDGQRLEQYLRSTHIQHLSGFDAAFAESDYRDEIHPNEQGQIKIAKALKPYLDTIIRHAS